MTQLPLDGIDWTDFGPDDEDEDEWNEEDEDEWTDPDPRLRDLHGQGLSTVQLHTITDVPLTGRYL
jgi:hypothetical protein